MGIEEPSTKKIRGDGLCLRLPSNEQILEITGDGCSIVVTKNHGSVRIIGDGCRLRIEQNLGDVEYTGDGGQVLLGAKSSRDRVKYTGDGGRVTLYGDHRTKNRKFEQPSNENEANVDERTSKGCSSQKNMDGTLNSKSDARKEAKRTGAGKKDRTEKVVKIVTTFQCNEKLVGEWFVNPEKVIGSFDGASFVKIVPKQRKITVEVK